METSDSDYFESADEDFVSDDETQIEQGKGVKDINSHTAQELVEKTEKLCMSDGLNSDIKTFKEVNSEEKGKEEKNILAKGDPKTQENSGADRKIISKSENTTTDCATSQTRQSEPGVDYSNTKIVHQSKRPEFGIPPARIGGCGLPRNRQQEIENRQSPNDGPKFHVPPAVSTSANINKTTENIKEEKPKRPEFGIPPARTTCWVPGVTNANTPNQKFEPHPAYLELMKKKQNLVDGKENEHSMWDNDDWGDFDIAANKDTNVHQPENPNQVSHKTNKNLREKLKSDDNVKKEIVDENMWEDDGDWEPVESSHQEKSVIEEREKEFSTGLQKEDQEKIPVTQAKEESSWSSWSNWGLSSVLSTATTLTSQVSQGISNVLETGIGAPDPEELARINKQEKEKIKEIPSNEDVPEEKRTLGFGLGNLVQEVTKLVESTGTKVISGGLDTLETIGKKTMEVLQENDPGLKKKRAFLKLDDKPILSQILREAKEKAEHENKELEKKHFARKANYEMLFDDHQGLVHLEALEMLSKQCDIKIQSLLESSSGSTLNDTQETLDQVKELCELPEEDDEEALTMDEIKERLESAVSEININITYKKLLATWEEVEDWLSKVNMNICNKNELHQQAIESLAQLTALAVEQFHKAGELLLVKDHRSTADEADSLTQLTVTLTTLIGVVAAKFSEKLNMIAADGSDKEEVNSLITNVFFEAANSSSYIQDAFQLLIPVLQVGAV